MRVLAPNIRFFVKNNVIGLFEQGDAGSTIGDFVRLRAWVLSHLMWNPDLDDQALIREFVEGYYGPAAPYLLEYLKLIHDAGDRSGVYLKCFMGDCKDYLSPEDLFAARRIFDKALAAVADDKTLSRRVRRERLPLDHAWLKNFNAPVSHGETSGQRVDRHKGSGCILRGIHTPCPRTQRWGLRRGPAFFRLRGTVATTLPSARPAARAVQGHAR